MTICVLVNCLILVHSIISRSVNCSSLPAFQKNISAQFICTAYGAREGERERMDKKTNLNANSLPRKDAWPPAHHSTDFSDWEIVKRKKRLSSTFLRILMFMMRRMRLMVMMMKMITTRTIMMTLTMIVRRMK